MDVGWPRIASVALDDDVTWNGERRQAIRVTGTFLSVTETVQISRRDKDNADVDDEEGEETDACEIIDVRDDVLICLPSAPLRNAAALRERILAVDNGRGEGDSTEGEPMGPLSPSLLPIYLLLASACLMAMVLGSLALVAIIRFRFRATTTMDAKDDAARC